MIEHSIPAGRVYTAKDMLEDPHFKSREAIIEVETEGHGKLKMQNAFPRFSQSPSGVRRSAPVTPGQHNREVLGEVLGWSEDDLVVKKEQGLI
ncbi:MAG: CoA transferase, partial [Pseudomonadota bacterium]